MKERAGCTTARTWLPAFHPDEIRSTMPVTHRVDVENRIVHTEYSGEVTDADLRAQYLALRNDPQFDPSFCEVIDTTHVTRAAVSSAALRECAGWVVFSSTARRALIAPTDLLYGVCRIYQGNLDRGGDVTHVFRTRVDAIAWITTGEMHASE